VRDTTEIGSVAELNLARPSAALASSYLDFIAEMRAAGETIYPSRIPVADESRDSFVSRLLSLENVAELPMVPQTIYWSHIDERVVGLIVLRHELSEKLAHFGGHISYEVRPSCRRRGIATSMLRRLLSTQRARTMRRFLVTCDPNNAASRKTIEANGGVLERIVFAEEVKRQTCHYLIDI